jgi:hypothetical protein
MAAKAKEPAAQAPKRTDWERIESEFRTASQSVREIAVAHGITEGAIRKRAKRDGWERDLSAKVRAKADALVRKELVRNEVRTETPTERESVEIGAQVEARIRIAHRSDITRMRVLVIRLLAECEAESADPLLFADLGELMKKPDERGVDKLNEVYMKTISLPQRIKGVKELAEALKVLIGLEREAYGIRPLEEPATKTVVFDLSAIPPAERQAAYLKLVSGT